MGLGVGTYGFDGLVAVLELNKGDTRKCNRGVTLLRLGRIHANVFEKRILAVVDETIQE